MSVLTLAKEFDNEIDKPAELPAGEYLMTIVSAEPTESKTKPGNYYMKLQLRLDPSDAPADFAADMPDEGLNMPPYNLFPLPNENGQWPGGIKQRYACQEHVKACGLKWPDGIVDKATREITGEHLVMQTVIAVVEHGKDLNGEDRAEVRKIKRAA